MSNGEPLAQVVPMPRHREFEGEADVAAQQVSEALLRFALRCKEVEDLSASDRSTELIQEVRVLAEHLSVVCDRWRSLDAPVILRDAVEGGRQLAASFLRQIGA